ncbi:hypothetical protein FAZ19_00180 [Sphingobacterium alkalisoli]|uniref:Peptidase MA-like domain-containing protein n=1 Tax=Sphingobacterium alkalisoli TaxID=1874115 RepID=A0A4U0H7N2_9SPHI|nr:hypothetical protein [Sphingobacterium alkalisoli]TJY67718.1 hypothetical protein FAZ19_00180 [Sphingobacterium alkalisoli]GGH11807.1 hypothetical protein GCM10011418_10910 [Sphingobacterium alkalisoli]
MKIKLLLFYLFLSLNSSAQINDNISISPNIDKNDTTNRHILLALDSFLLKKDTASYPELFKYWDINDFERFRTPYYFLKGIEKNGAGEVAYKASVMEILPLKNDVYIVKISYISTSPSNLFVKVIFNLIAKYNDGKVLFSSYINLIDDKWKEIIDGEAKYIVSPNRNSFYDQDIQKQRDFNNFISEYLKVEKVPYTFYSTGSVEEFFNIQGFQYHPMMYADSTGGIVFNNIIISANNSEFYPHEIAHLYIKKRMPNINSYFDEGLATYLGGSGKIMYQDYLNKLKENIDEYDLLTVFKKDIFDKSLWEADMPITYVLAAVICDYGINKMGKDKFFDIVDGNKDNHSILNQLGIGEAEFNSIIKDFINQ